jgi:hypothetical protein
MANHEDMGCSEHQICLSKGVITKFVQPLDLVLAVRAHAPVARSVRVCSVVAHEETCGRPDGYWFFRKIKATAAGISICRPRALLGGAAFLEGKLRQQGRIE